MNTPAAERTTAQPLCGCTLQAYAAAKRLPEPFLRSLGLKDGSFCGSPAIRVPYLDEASVEVGVRFRVALEKGPQADNRFRWRRGDKPRLYGLWNLGDARAAGFVVLVEGESDAQTLWFHGVPAIGLPGAQAWNEEWVVALDGIPTVYVVIEPDKGGDAVREWLGRSRLRDRVRLVTLGDVKDPSDLFISDPGAFLEHWNSAIRNAVSWEEQAQRETAARTGAAWERCAGLARSPRILDRLADILTAIGLVGENRAASLVFLCLVSRFLKRPVSAAIKGPSSGGKSQIIQCCVQLFPPSAYYTITGMSERVLAYSKEPLIHRVLVICEAPGIGGEFTSYLLRSLLSEGRVRYETVEKTPQGLQPRVIEREGPTGLLVTTTAVRLHAEIETRIFSIPVCDTAEQTRQVMTALAMSDQVAGRPDLHLDAWHALQEWLEGAEHRVVIPYAQRLAEAVPPLAVRLRRDFGALLSLIRAHAILHQAGRERDDAGRVVASLDDYSVVRRLVADLIAEGVQSAVGLTVRETVEAVAALGCGGEGTTATAVARRLRLDKSSALRRLREAGERGYVTNAEQRRSQPGRWVIADPLPAELEVLPAPSALDGGCAVARASEGYIPPVPPDGDHVVAHMDVIAQSPLASRPGGEAPPSTSPAPMETCRLCNGEIFWRRAEGNWLCAACHPTPCPEAVAEECAVGRVASTALDLTGCVREAQSRDEWELLRADEVMAGSSDVG